MAVVSYPMAACGTTTRRPTIDVMDFIPDKERGRIAAGVSMFDCTTAIQNGIAQADKMNGTLHIGSGTYNISTVIVSGSNYAIETDEQTIFKQIQSDDIRDLCPVIQITSCRNVIINRIFVAGNIHSDVSEYSHAVVIGKSNGVRIGYIYAQDVRGDALCCYGRNTYVAERLDNLYVGVVSGYNVFRNLVSVIGGHVNIGEIRNTGPVGYRDLDVEPNAGGGYQPADVFIKKAVIGSLEVTSDDPKLTNLSLKIDEFDADGRRIRPTTPPYPGAPGRNGYALGIAHVASVEIGSAKLRNYASYAVNIGSNDGEIIFHDLDIANCDFDERTFNSVIAKRGSTNGCRLVIDRIHCAHSDNSKWLIHSDQPGMPVEIGGGEISGGLLAVNCVVDARHLTIDAGGAQGPAAGILIGAGGSRLASVSLERAHGATLLNNSPNCSLVAVSGDVAAIANDDTNINIVNSTVRPFRAGTRR